MFIQISVNDQPVQALLRGLRQRLSDLTPVMADIGEAVVSQVMDSFEGGESPGGDKWPLSKRVLKHGGQTLVDKANLRNSIAVYDYDKDSVTVGTAVVYGAIHQFGGMAGRGRKTKIPARPYMPDERSLDWPEIAEMITLHLGQ